MDSNNHFVDWSVFWKNINGKKEKTFCGSLFDIEDRITTENRINNIKHVIISIGVNDLDTKTPQEVFDQLKVIIDLMDRKYNQPKFVIGEITPRLDEKDDDVIMYNTILKEFTEKNERMYLAKQDRLRTADNRHHYDSKHITQYAVPIFVASIKNALRAACGLTNKNR